MNDLRHEIEAADHAPRHGGSLAVGPERELCGAGGGEGFQELEVDPDQLGRAALRQRHASFAHLLVAGPRVDRADPSRRALVRLLHRRIHLRPRVPRVPLVEIVHPREGHRRGGGDGDRPRHAVLGWPRGHDDDEHDDDHGERDEDLREHHVLRSFSRIDCSRTASWGDRTSGGKSAASKTWRISITSPSAKGTRLAQATASSLDFTWIIQKPATSSRAGNGPSVTVVFPRENVMRAPFALGWIPSPASITPAFTISSLNRPIAVISSVLGITPASVFLSARTNIMNRIVSPWWSLLG